MNPLGVWMDGAKVGELSRHRSALTFTYTAAALEEFGLGRPLLSVSMPTRPRPFRGAVPHAFFNGLLPEGEARQMIAYDFGVEESDVLGLLGALGRDCAGALVVIPGDEVPEVSATPEPIGEEDVSERLARLGVHPLGVDGRVRASLAGMQRKLLLSGREGGWGLPVGGAPSTHILKPPHHDLRFPQMIANEALCLRAAHHLGLPVAKVEVGSFAGTDVLIVERYDRTPRDDAGGVARIHQEDFCQATAIDGTRLRKYEEGGGPSLRMCARTLTDWSRDPYQRELLLELITFNVLVGNGDCHGKNLSLLHDQAGGVRLAPAYDIFSTIWYEAASTVPGMFVNDVRELSEISKADLISEAISWGLGADVAAARVERVLAAGEDALLRAAGEIECPEELVHTLISRSRALASA